MLFPWNTILTYAKNSTRISLPWREYEAFNTKTLTYRVWLSEILLQQTQAERVIPFFEKIIHAFPDTETLSQTDYGTFFPYYQGMGYYSRARNILKTAHIVAHTYSGIFPEDKKALMDLPGIGEYTSSAILAFGYGKSYLAWDTNLEKVFSRYICGTSKQTLSPAQKSDIEADFVDFIESFEVSMQKTIVRHINNGLMDFARLVDDKNPLNIDWDTYPLQSGKFYETRGSLEVFESKKQENFPIPDAKIIAIVHENHKKYFSIHPMEYTPFLLPTAESRDTRGFVKDYFRTTFWLEVSVRPIHKKWLSWNSEPFVAVNVQIQTGKHDFTIFEKKEAKRVLESIFIQ